MTQTIDVITCPECDTEIEVKAASLMGKRKKTMTPAALQARRENAKKGGRPKKREDKIDEIRNRNLRE